MAALRRAINKVRSFTNQGVITAIEFYRITLSPLLGNRCRFYPSCSVYAQDAVRRFGVRMGVWLALKRIVKCHPWYKGSWNDPVPEEK